MLRRRTLEVSIVDADSQKEGLVFLLVNVEDLKHPVNHPGALVRSHLMANQTSVGLALLVDHVFLDRG